jgi:hypothetical protein
MLKLDNNLLDELGLGALPEDQKRGMLQHIYETLELRVGTDLANQMTDRQLEEFEKFIDEGGDANQAQALQWLEANLPNYKQVVNEVFEALKAEIRQMAPQLLAATANDTPSQPAPQPGMTAPQPAQGYSYPPQPPAQPMQPPQPPQQPPQGYPEQQPPAGPGGYPPQYPGQ